MYAQIQDVDGPNSKGKYSQIVVTYTNDKDENKTVNLVSFGDGKDVYDAFASGEYGPGSTVNFKMKKNGQYWNVVGIEEASGDAPKRPENKTKTASGNKSSGWQPDPSRETPEERHKKNLAICRQNALTNSINFVSREVVQDLHVETVLKVADQFFRWTAQDYITDEAVAEEVVKKFK